MPVFLPVGGKEICPKITVMMLAVLLSAVWVVPSAVAEAAPETVIFGGDANYPPLEWDDRGRETGFVIDLEDALADLGGFQPVHQLGDWPDVVGALEDGTVDVVPMFVSDERRTRFRFTSPFYHLSHAIYSAPEVPAVGSVADLQGERVAVERSSYAHRRLQELQVDATAVLTRNTREALEAVVEGRATYAILAAPVAERLIDINDFDLRAGGPTLWPQAYAFAVAKDRDDLANRLEQLLARAILSGRYEAVYESWEDHLVPRERSLWERLRWIVLIATPIGIAAAAALAWSWALRRTVNKRTRQLREQLHRRKAAEAQLRYLANFDRHTDMPEYHHLVELVDGVLSTAGNDAATREVVVLRLAEMDDIVRTFGYTVAREFVRSFAARMKSLDFEACGYLGRGVFAVVGQKDAVTARMPDLTTELATTDMTLYPQVLGGVAYWPGHGTKAADVIRHAETALSVAISRNHSWAVYHPSMEPDQRDMQIVAAFRACGGRGLSAVLQPQIDLRSGRVVAAEALVRWTNPKLGSVPPGKLVQLLERAGLINQVTAFMIDEAVRIAVQLRRKHGPCPVSVNVAAYDLLATDLPSTVEDALARHAGRPSDLKLELTETSVMDDPEQAQRVLEKLRELGIAIAIDDFGTGYASLSYLSSFPISELKIDQAFVRDMLWSRRNASIVRSTIAMAHELGLLTVAEGAEDMATVDALRDYGCMRVQGYAISKPVPEAELSSLLTQPRRAFG